MVPLTPEQIRAIAKIPAESYILEESYEKALYVEVTVWPKGQRIVIAPNGRTHGKTSYLG